VVEMASASAWVTGVEGWSAPGSLREILWPLRPAFGFDPVRHGWPADNDQAQSNYG